VRKHPGLRVPGHGDGFELLVRAIVGQQVSVAGARTVLGRMTSELGRARTTPIDGLTHHFPDAGALAGASPTSFPMPKARAATIRHAARAVASGELRIDPGVEREELRRRLGAVAGVGPWTVAYVGVRALGDPDVFMPTDLGVRHALEQLGCSGDARAAAERAQSWRPWRSYALLHLWTGLSGGRRNDR
jgi:AraC family transcriptional regulator of adaptative response / DNA-3-methyladenine glycosylase II